jgi:hypothetical protein
VPLSSKEKDMFPKYTNKRNRVLSKQAAKNSLVSQGMILFKSNLNRETPFCPEKYI